MGWVGGKKNKELTPHEEDATEAAAAGGAAAVPSGVEDPQPRPAPGRQRGLSPCYSPALASRRVPAKNSVV